MTRDQTRRLFENITDQDLVERRKSYLAEIWVPLANTFIGLANGKDGSSFNLGEIITDPKVMTNLEEDMDRVRGNIIIEELADFVIKYRKKKQNKKTKQNKTKQNETKTKLFCFVSFCFVLFRFVLLPCPKLCLGERYCFTRVSL